MGRKNNRIQKTEDKNFSKFISSFMAEQREEKNRRRDFSSTSHNGYSNDYSRINTVERSKERLNYAISQLELYDIQYTILDESKTLLECYRKSDNLPIRFYASNGYIIKFTDFRGINALINLLLC